MPDSKTYYSNGKLLLTGEYLVLEGALALGVPTTFGQNLSVQAIDEPVIDWKSFDNENTIWFYNLFQYPLQISDSSNTIAQTLHRILREAQKLNPNFLLDTKGFSVKTQLDFPKNWGLGSSSTLLNNIAQWAEIDAYTLLQNTLGGSGYDVACAQYDYPIFYQLDKGKPLVSDARFAPVFKEQLYFVYLNKKQQSAKEIQRFKQNVNSLSLEITTISEITQLLPQTYALDDFEKMLKEHEHIMSIVLQRKPVQKQLFADYFGQIKSLGAWGGDFILATGNEDTPKYFQKKGFETVLLYDEMVL